MTTPTTHPVEVTISITVPAGEAAADTIQRILTHLESQTRLQMAVDLAAELGPDTNLSGSDDGPLFWNGEYAGSWEVKAR